jgi:hypothetical protein
MPINVIAKIGKYGNFKTHCRGYLFNYIRDHYECERECKNYPLMIGAVGIDLANASIKKIINHGRYQKIKKWINETINACFPDIKVKKILINYDKRYVKIFIDYFPDIKKDVLYVSTISLIARLTLRYILHGNVFSPEFIPFIDTTYGQDILNLINFTKELGHAEIIRQQRKMLKRCAIEGHNGLEYTINELCIPLSLGNPKRERIKKLIGKNLIENGKRFFLYYIVPTKDIQKLKRIINLVEKDAIKSLYITDHKNKYSSIVCDKINVPIRISSILKGYVPVDMPDDLIEQIKKIVRGD